MPAVCHFLIVCVFLTMEQSTLLDDNNIDLLTLDNSNITTFSLSIGRPAWNTIALKSHPPGLQQNRHKKLPNLNFLKIFSLLHSRGA